MQNLTKSLRQAEVLIIIPPFASMTRASLGVHTLQAVAAEQGFTVDVFYANVLYAAHIGTQLFVNLSDHASLDLVGERLFSAAAFGSGERAFSPSFQKHLLNEGYKREEIDRLIEIAAQTPAWVEAVAEQIAACNYKIVGSSTTFEQTNASIAFLNAIKRRNPDSIAIIGGANCEGPMAAGIASLSPLIDYIFSGESETTFLDFLNRWKANDLPAEKVFFGEPNRAMDAIPCPDYTQYYEQLYDFTTPEQLEGIVLWIPYETSRGCWWGQKHHCTFCGLNGNGMGFRQKSADRIIDDLRKLSEQHPNKHVAMADNIMPNNYFRTLLPRLAAEAPDFHIFYEQKANLDLRKVMLLRQAGIMSIQPGIEALSTPLLRLMDKGVSAAQNIALLRYGLINGIEVKWNLLCGFPGDQLAWYEDTLRILQHITHLQPATGIYPLSIERFSPYFERPDNYGVSDIRPRGDYLDVFPPTADIVAAAYHFNATFASDTYRYEDFLKSIGAFIADWKARWSQQGVAVPVLSVTRAKENVYVLKDTRGLPGTKQFQFIDREQAAVALAGLPHTRRDSALWAWGVENRVALELDNHLVPLALATNELLLELEGAVTTPATPVPAPGLIMPA